MFHPKTRRRKRGGEGNPPVWGHIHAQVAVPAHGREVDGDHFGHRSDDSIGVPEPLVVPVGRLALRWDVVGRALLPRGEIPGHGVTAPNRDLQEGAVKRMQVYERVDMLHWIHSIRMGSRNYESTCVSRHAMNMFVLPLIHFEREGVPNAHGRREIHYRLSTLVPVLWSSEQLSLMLLINQLVQEKNRVIAIFLDVQPPSCSLITPG
jgi:hypothetical protein